MATYIIDTYAWVSYFEGNRRFKAEIEENELLYTPSIVLAELARVMKKKRVPKAKYNSILEFVRKKSLVLPLEEDTAIKAGELAQEEKLYVIDAIIYAHADEDKALLTGDEHFRGKPYVRLIR